MGGDQFCQYYSYFTNGVELDAGAWFCHPANDTGGDCMNDGWCKAGICDTDTTYQCKSPAILFPPTGLCTSIVKP
jgi:hypothetical protein